MSTPPASPRPATVYLFETGGRGSYRSQVLRRLAGGLGWRAGGVRRVLASGLTRAASIGTEAASALTMHPKTAWTDEVPWASQYAGRAARG